MNDSKFLIFIDWLYLQCWHYCSYNLYEDLCVKEDIGHMNIVEPRDQIKGPFVHLWTIVAILTQSGMMADAFNTCFHMVETCGSL